MHILLQQMREKKERKEEMIAGVVVGVDRDTIKLVSRSLGDVSKPCLLMISGKSSNDEYVCRKK